MGIFIVGLLTAIIGYLPYPLFLILKKAKLSERRIKKISIWNSVIVYLLFTLIHIITNGDGANMVAAVTWSFIVRWLLLKNCLADTEEEKSRYSYNKQFDEHTDKAQSNSNKSQIEFKNDKIRYCSRCGDAIHPGTSTCEICGKKYFDWRKCFKFLIVLLILVVIGGITGAVGYSLGVKNTTVEMGERIRHHISKADEWEEKYETTLEQYNEYIDVTKDKVAFYDTNIVFVIEGFGDYYFNYTQMQVVTRDMAEFSYWAYNKEAAISLGYKAWK